MAKAGTKNLDSTPKKDQRSKIKDQGPVVSRLGKWLPWILVIGGVIGILASAMITIEKFDLLKNPGSTFICDLNPVISCGNVMQTPQAEVFGFMNPLIGLIGFPVLVAIGMAMFAGAKFKRWFWLGLEIGLSLGIIFAYWLLYQSIYNIGALCPYCLSVDVALTTIWWYVTLYLFGKGYARLPQKLQKVGTFARKHHLDILIFWFLLVTVVIFNHFWYYFGPHWFHMGS